MAGAYSYFQVQNGSPGYATMAIFFGLPSNPPEQQTYDPLDPDKPYIAYIDEDGYPSIYDVIEDSIAWHAAWPSGDVNVNDHLLWSPDGSLLLFPCINQYLGILNTCTMEQHHIPIANLDTWFWDACTSWEWSPSQLYVIAKAQSSEKNSNFIIIDIKEALLVQENSACTMPVWSPDEQIVGYSLYHSTADSFYYTIHTLNLNTGQENTAFTGESECTAQPNKWTEDGALMFIYQKNDQVFIRDTKGRSYLDSPENKGTIPVQKPTNSMRTVIDTPKIVKPAELEKHFVYVNEQNRVAISASGLTYPLWVSKYECPQYFSPVLSPDGSTVAYVCRDAMGSNWYLALLEVNSKNETFIEIGSTPWYFDVGAAIRWAPSQQFVSIEDYSYPTCPFIIVDVLVEKVLFTCLSSTPLLWSPDCSKTAYVEIEGEYMVFDPDVPAPFTSKLIVYDVHTGEKTILVEGERGCSIFPERWTGQGDIVYRYINHVNSEELMLDTQGGTYDYPEDPSTGIGSTPTTPPGFPEDLGKIRSSEQHSITGEWLVTVLTGDGTTWIYHYIEGEIPARMVQGRDHVWLGVT